MSWLLSYVASSAFTFLGLSFLNYEMGIEIVVSTDMLSKTDENSGTVKYMININYSLVIRWHDSIIVSKHSPQFLGFTSLHPPNSPLISVSSITTCSGTEARV